MKTLAIDTSGKYGVVGLSNGEQVVSEISATSHETHSARLLPSIDMVLELSGWKLDDIELFGVVIGPGSFTGLRVGVATIKGLSWSKKTPVVPINSLEALARGAVNTEKLICPMIDARRGRVYGAIFHYVNGQLKEVVPQNDIDPIDLIRSISQPVLCLGDGAEKYEAELRDFSHVEIAPESFQTPRGQLLCQMTLAGYRAGKVKEGEELDPLYLSLSEAERLQIAKTR